MLHKIKQLFGIEPPTDYKAIVANGGLIIDVRTREEYQQGHIKGSINVPLNVLMANLSKLKTNKPIITCCASGMRSASAKSMLVSKGYKEVYNGGGWHSLQYKLK
ncbi:MAG: rhodanese-like domain-containing protein [Bacteroidota bacterium]|jgi:phage shock protein E